MQSSARDSRRVWTPDAWPEGTASVTSSGEVGDQACQTGLPWEQLPLAVVWVETEPRRLLKRHEHILSRQQEALWHPITDVETEADKMDSSWGWGGD